MTSEEAYQQYEDLMDRTKREKAERDAAAERQRQEFSKLSPEVQKVVQAGDEYVKKIRAANDAIPGEEISAKISRMEMLVDRIFDRVEEHPESVDDIRKLMEYYLPRRSSCWTPMRIWTPSRCRGKISFPQRRRSKKRSNIKCCI